MQLRTLLRRGTQRRKLWQGHDRVAKAGFLAALVRPYLPVGARHLDIACGRGEVLEAFGALGWRGVGLDLAPQLLLQCRRKHLVVVRADMRGRLPFGDNAFGAVSLISTIEHVPQPEHLIGEVARVLAPGGVAVLQIPNPYFPIDLHYLLPLYGYLPPGVQRRYRRLFASQGYPIDYYTAQITKRQLRALCRGFVELCVRDLVYPMAIAPDWLKPLYGLYTATRLAQLMPTGHLLVYRKNK